MNENEIRKKYYEYLINEWKNLCNSGMPQPLIERSFPLIVKPLYYFAQEFEEPKPLEAKPGGMQTTVRPVYGAKEGAATAMQKQIIGDRLKRPAQTSVVETFFAQFGVSSVEELKFSQAKVILDALGVKMKVKG